MSGGVFDGPQSGCSGGEGGGPPKEKKEPAEKKDESSKEASAAGNIYDEIVGAEFFRSAA